MEIWNDMKVRIIKCDVTEKQFNITPEMRRMIGKTGKIEYIFTSGEGHPAVEIDGWTWSPDDLRPALQPLDIKEIEQKSELFDPSNLDIG